MSLTCKWLHDRLKVRWPEAARWPFDSKKLPRNAIYFFYELGEMWGHGGDHPRIVHVGTHRNGNFGSRMDEHYVPDEQEMKFNWNQPAPKDRSILRKNIGRALLHRDRDDYLAIWNINFTSRDNRERMGPRRDVEKEKQIEGIVTRILRERFTFRWIELRDQERRMGPQGLNRELIGTLARCSECRPSPEWLGRFSPKEKIKENGLWLEHHLQATELTQDSMAELAALIGEP